MPFPVAHMLVGAAVAEGCLPRTTKHRPWKVLAGAALGLAPDLDFIFVWWFGLSRDWHRGFTHSIAFSVGFGVLLLAARGRSTVRETIALVAAVLSHSVLDFLTSVRSAGVELLWPFSGERFGLRIVRLLEPQISVSTLEDAIRAAPRISLVEAAVFLPVLALVWAARRWSFQRSRVR